MGRRCTKQLTRERQHGKEGRVHFAYLLKFEHKKEDLHLCKSSGIVGRGGRNRTFCLQVMSLTSYQCSTPLSSMPYNIAEFFLLSRKVLQFFLFFYEKSAEEFCKKYFPTESVQQRLLQMLLPESTRHFLPGSFSCQFPT